MEPNVDEARREQWKQANPLASVIALLVIGGFVGALLMAVSDPIGSAIDRQDRAQSEMVQKLVKEMRGYE